MKKTVCVLLFLFTAFFAFRTSVCAYDGSETESLALEVGADELDNGYLTDSERSGDSDINIFQKAVDIIADSFSGSGGVLASFGSLIAIIMLSAVMSAMKFGGEALDTATSYISILVLAGASYALFDRLLAVVVASMESLTVALSAQLPVMTALHVCGGTPASGAAGSTSMTLFLSVLSLICTRVILPLVRISFALCLAGAMPSSINLSPITNLIKNTSTTVMTFIFTMLSFLLYIQTSVAATGDGFLTRSVKFASGVFIPIIGGILGDASRTVLASVGVIKGTVGAVGVVTVLAVVLPPIITVAIHKILLLLCSIVAKSLSCDRESAFLSDLCGVTNVLLALVAGAGSVALISMAVFLKSGVYV